MAGMWDIITSSAYSIIQTITGPTVRAAVFLWPTVAIATSITIPWATSSFLAPAFLKLTSSVPALPDYFLYAWDLSNGNAVVSMILSARVTTFMMRRIKI